MQERYQDRWNKHMMADCCWSIQKGCNTPDALVSEVYSINMWFMYNCTCFIRYVSELTECIQKVILYYITRFISHPIDIITYGLKL